MRLLQALVRHLPAERWPDDLAPALVVHLPMSSGGLGAPNAGAADVPGYPWATLVAECERAGASDSPAERDACAARVEEVVLSAFGPIAETPIRARPHAAPPSDLTRSASLKGNDMRMQCIPLLRRLLLVCRFAGHGAQDSAQYSARHARAGLTALSDDEFAAKLERCRAELKSAASEVGAAAAPAATNEAKLPPKSDADAPSSADFAGMKIGQLKEQLRALGLPVSGKKAELVQRLQAAPAAEAAADEAEASPAASPASATPAHSGAVDNPSAAVPVEAEADGTGAAAELPNLADLKVNELKDLLRANGCKVGGNKDALIQRCKASGLGI